MKVKKEVNKYAIAAQYHINKLADLGLIDVEKDAINIELFTKHYSYWLQAVEAVDAEGITRKAKTGLTAKNPNLSIAENECECLRRLLIALNLKQVKVTKELSDIVLD